MDAQESTYKFKKADQYFREGHYEAALELLSELNRAHPNAKNVLYPAAMCLEKLGRAEEALPICEQLIRQFQDPRAQELKARVVQSQQMAGGDALADLGLTGAGDILDMGPPASAAPAYAPVDDGTEWWKYALMGLGTVVVLAIIIVPLMTYEAPPEPPPGASNGEGTYTFDSELLGQSIGIGAFILLLGMAFAGEMVGGYLALMVLNQLPSDKFVDNCISLGITLFLAGLANLVPFVGPIAALVIVAQVYDLGCGGLLLFAVMSNIGAILAMIIPFVILFGSLAAIAPA